MEVVLKHIFRFVTLMLIASFTVGQTAPSLIQFTPTTDTIGLGSGCTPPLLTYTVSRDSLAADSIIIRPGFNTSMGYRDSAGTGQSLEYCAFIVFDSTAHWNYEVWYHPIDTSWIYESSFAVPPDSALEFYETFLLTVYVKSETHVLDSLAQVFHAIQYGLGTTPERGNISAFTLYPNFPNPFNAQTHIAYTLHQSVAVTMALYDLTGQVVWSRTIPSQTPGRYQYQFAGNSFPSGLYFFRLTTPEGSMMQKWCIIK